MDLTTIIVITGILLSVTWVVCGLFFFCSMAFYWKELSKVKQTTPNQERVKLLMVVVTCIAVFGLLMALFVIVFLTVTTYQQHKKGNVDHKQTLRNFLIISFLLSMALAITFTISATIAAAYLGHEKNANPSFKKSFGFAVGSSISGILLTLISGATFFGLLVYKVKSGASTGASSNGNGNDNDEDEDEETENKYEKTPYSDTFS